MLIRENWAELLEPGLKTIYNKHQKKLKDFIPVLFNVETSKKAAEHTLGTGNLGLMEEWTASGGQVAYEDIDKGYSKTYTHKKYSKGLKIERELLEDDQYSEIKKRTRAIAQSVYYTRQAFGVGMYNNALSAAYAGPDGKALCATDHPLGPQNSTTWSNLATAKELNATNVEYVRGQMKKWTDDKGNLLAINPDTLIVHTDRRKQALVIADSPKEPDTAENNVNIWKGSVRVIEVDFLTDPKLWFMVDSTRLKQFANWFDRRRAQLEMEKSFDTEVAKWKSVMRVSWGWDDPSWIFACYED